MYKPYCLLYIFLFACLSMASDDLDPNSTNMVLFPSDPQIRFYTFQDNGPGDADWAFEGRPQLALFLFNNIYDYLYEQKTGPSTSVRIDINTQLRMSTARSMPVIMPSFNPGIVLETGIPWYGSSTRVLTGILGMHHYSNGQRGCTYNDTLGDWGECQECNELAVADGDLDKKLNRSTGDFSMNFLRTGIGFTTLLYDDNYYESRRNSLFLTFDINSKNLPADMNDNARNAYGTLRVSLGNEFKIYRTILSIPSSQQEVRIILIDGARLWLKGVYARNKSSAPDMRFEIEAGIHIPAGFFLNAGFETGQDDYNARFVDYINRFYISFSTDYFAKSNKNPTENMN